MKRIVDLNQVDICRKNKNVRAQAINTFKNKKVNGSDIKYKYIDIIQTQTYSKCLHYKNVD